MLDYTLCFIVYKDKILLVNREKDPWMGRWNGIGGKIEADESPLYNIKKEILEETGINPYSLRIECKGVVTWNATKSTRRGLVLYVAYPIKRISLEVPKETREGILDLKSLDWILHEGNIGLADNIPYFLPIILSESDTYHFACTFDEDVLVDVTQEKIEDINQFLGE